MKLRAPWYPRSMTKSYQSHSKVHCHMVVPKHVLFMETTDKAHTISNISVFPRMLHYQYILTEGYKSEM